MEKENNQNVTLSNDMEDGKKLPGYFRNKPTFRSVHELRKYLGFQDACIQSNEIALRFFEENAQNHLKGVDSFVREMSDRYKISHGTNELKHLKKNMIESYIVQTYNNASLFFRYLISEYKELKEINDKHWKKKKKNGENLDHFRQLYLNLPLKGRIIIHSAPERKIIDYYRLVRNSIVHINEKSRKRLLLYFYKTREEHNEYFKKCYPCIEAPNSPNDLKFDDFILYTRSLKYYSNLINDACDLSIDDIAKKANKDINLQKKLKGFEDIKNEKVRGKRIGILKGYFKKRYGNKKEHLDLFCNFFLPPEYQISLK